MRFCCTCYLVFISLVLLTSQSLYAQSKEQIQKYEQAITLINQNKGSQGTALLEEIIEENPDYEEARYALSYYAMQQGKYQNALHEYQYLLRQNPKNHELYLYRGQAYLLLGLFAEAEEDYLIAYQIDSTQIDVSNALGTLYYWMELPEDAIHYFSKSILKDPKDALAYYYRALAYYENKNLDQAWADITQYNSLEPSEPDGQRLKAMILIAQNKHNSAISVFESLEKDDDMVFEEEDFFYWGQAYYFLRKYEEAKFYLELPEEPQLPMIYHYLGKVYYHLNQSDSALIKLNETILIWKDAQPEEIAAVYYDRAIVNSKQKNSQEAENDFLKSIYLMPEIINQKNNKGEDIPLLSNALTMLKLENQYPKLDSVLIKGYQARAERMIASGDSNRAVATCNAAINLDSLVSYNHTLKAGAYLISKSYKEALSNLNKAEKLSKGQNLAQNYYFKALLYQAQNQPDSVQIFLDKAQSIDPQKAAIYFEKTLLHLRKNDYKEALLEINKALTLEAQNEDYLNERTNIYLELQNYALAIQDADAVIRQNPKAVRALYQRGLAYKATKQYQQALDDFDAILDMYPDETEVIELALEMQSKLDR